MTIAEGAKFAAALRALVCAACLASAAAASAEPAAGGFDETLTLAGQQLHLNGAGLRSVFIVKWYVAALYVPERSHDPERLLAQNGPRRLAMRMLADKSAARLTRAFRDGLRNNHDDAELHSMQPQIDALFATFEDIGTARQGDLL
ncbi:MAG TPA: chalcone isomerase family protein, partial [Burkholderiaceae bacterium]|nr:chalcone isomerase family protein [Burkholderiaceae bacterium]